MMCYFIQTFLLSIALKNICTNIHTEFLGQNSSLAHKYIECIKNPQINIVYYDFPMKWEL